MKSRTMLIACLLFSLPIIVIVMVFLPAGLRQSFGQEQDYAQAKQAVKSGDKEFAFMHFYNIAKNYPNAKYRQEALFATGEHLFSVLNYSSALKAFRDLLENYPDTKMKPLALFYILKIAQNTEEDALAKEAQRQLMDWEKVILIFKESKEYNFKSPMGTNYKLTHYIDRMEFYIDGKLQACISY